MRLPPAEQISAKARSPVGGKADGAKSASLPAAGGKKPWQAEDDFNPYQVKIEPDKPPPEDDRVDEMVRDEFRKRKRDRAWKEVGFPAKLMKIMGMIIIALSLLIFLLATLDIILYNFKLEQLNLKGSDQDAPRASGEKIDLPELFIADLFNSPPGEAPTGILWLIWFGMLVLDLGIFGTILAGAESMKRLENYTLSMVACILAIIFGGLILSIAGLLGLLALLKEDVKLEFPSYRKQREKKEEEEWAAIEEERRRRREGLPPDDEEEDEE
jgi:hypothetical protein